MAQTKCGDTAKIHYTAKLRTDIILAATLKKPPLQFTLGACQVIQVVEKAVLGINQGESKIVTIPSDRIFDPSLEGNII